VRLATKAIYVGLFGLLLALPACHTEKRRLITTTCKAVRQYLGLSDDDYIKCIKDRSYREHLVWRRDTQWSQNLSDSHNKKLKIIFPQGSSRPYVRVSRSADLPLKDAAKFSGPAAERHLGNRYVIAGTLVEQEDGSGKVSVLVRADADGKESLIVALDALDKNQKTFIRQHCWLNTTTYSSSMCHGDVYISVRRELNGSFIVYELDGAACTPASAAKIFSVLSRDNF
jgi:hypothetical protein